MTADEFNALPDKLGISRAELARRIGIAPNSATAYAGGRKPVPLTVALACAAIAAGLGPYGSPEVSSSGGSGGSQETLQR